MTPLCKPFLRKQPTIFRGENAMTIMFDTVCPPFEKSWLRPCDYKFLCKVEGANFWKYFSSCFNTYFKLFFFFSLDF